MCRFKPELIMKTFRRHKSMNFLFFQYMSGEKKKYHPTKKNLKNKQTNKKKKKK